MSTTTTTTTATAAADNDLDGAAEAYRENPGTDRSRYASEISSSLPLQILLYYNGLVSAAYLVLEGGLITEKVRRECVVRNMYWFDKRVLRYV